MPEICPRGDEVCDRLIILERDFMHSQETLKCIRKEVGEMHDLLMQAKGARWMIIALAGVSGLFSSLLLKYFPGMH